VVKKKLRWYPRVFTTQYEFGSPFFCGHHILGMNKKIKKSRKQKKIKNKKLKKPNRKKKPIKILKKPAGSVRFRFYKPKTEKTEPNPNRKKNEPNQ